MKKLLLGAVAAAALTGSANAAVITLQMITSNDPNAFTFTYRSTLGPDEGLRIGDQFIIYDFAGYIDGSVFSNAADISASAELVSANPFVTPGFTDDPTIANLVFTYTGTAFRDSAGPLAPFDIAGIGAQSIFGGIASDAFFGLTTKNNPDNRPGGTGTKVYSLGSVAVPTAVPEPASWALMITGFALAGAAMRRSRTHYTTARQ